MKKISIFCVIIIFITILFIIASPGKTNFNSKDFHTEKYAVKSGDTLWAIGRRCIGENADIREWAEAVEIINNITVDIYPGQSIIVYVYNN